MIGRAGGARLDVLRAQRLDLLGQRARRRRSAPSASRPWFASRHARAPARQRRERVARQRRRAVGRVPRAADVVAARLRDHVVERGDRPAQARQRGRERSSACARPRRRRDAAGRCRGGCAIRWTARSRPRAAPSGGHRRPIDAASTSSHGTPVGVISRPSAVRADTLPDVPGVQPARHQPARGVGDRAARCRSVATPCAPLGEQPRQPFARGGRDAALGDDAGDEARGRDVEAGVVPALPAGVTRTCARVARRGHARDRRDLVGRALLDRDAVRRRRSASSRWKGEGAAT